jgi:hypothetical protein
MYTYIGMPEAMEAYLHHCSLISPFARAFPLALNTERFKVFSDLFTYARV